MKKFLHVIAALLVASCGYSEQEVRSTISAIPTQTAYPTYTPLSTYTRLPTATTFTISNTETATVTFTPTVTQTPQTVILSIPYHVCSEGIGFAANASYERVPLIEKDEIVDYYRLVTIKYSITNRYNLTDVEFAVTIDGYPYSYGPSTDDYMYRVIHGRTYIKPKETAVLRSYHVFAPDNWIEGHGGFTLTHQIGNGFMVKIPAFEGREIHFKVAYGFGEEKVENDCGGLIRLPEPN